MEKRRLPIEGRATPNAILRVAQEELALVLDFEPPERASTVAAESALEWADGLVGEIEERLARERPSACRSGCDHCCHLKVLVSAVEVLAIAHHLRSRLRPDELSSLTAAVEEAADDVGSLTQAARVRARRACPLLERGTCRVYPVRPLHCWGANSDDASACARALDQGDEDLEIPLYAPQQQVAELLTASHSNAAGRLSLDARVLELTRALRIALETPHAAARWHAGEKVFEDAVDEEFRSMMEASR